MEFVGRKVKKEFEGHGVFSGIVKSYDPSSGIFEVVYDDGGSEELDCAEVSFLIEGKVQLVGDEVRPSRLGRKPKKRRRVEKRHEIPGESGNAGEAFMIDGVASKEILGKRCGFDGDLNKNDNSHDGSESNLDMGIGNGGKLRENVEVNGHLNENANSGDRSEETLVEREDLKDGVSVNGIYNLNRIDNLKGGIDLNAGFNLNLNDACDVHVNAEENLKKRDCIDLNLDVNGDLDENLNVGGFGPSPKESRRRGCSFDLNLEVDECKDSEDDGGGQFMVVTSSETVEESLKDSGGDVGERLIEDVGSNETLKEVHLDVVESFMGKGVVSSSETTVKYAHSGFADQLSNDNGGSGGDVKANAFAMALDTNHSEDCGLVEVQLKDDLSGAVTQMVHGHLGNSVSPCNQRSNRRKRRKLSDNIKSTTETVLRRSTRRGSAQNHVSVALCTVDDTSSSPGVSEITEEKPIRCKESEKPILVPPKLQLPPSSQNLNLDDIPVLDIFSIYACLRSFSTLLFLSPFELEDFVAAVQFKSANLLFDNVHVSILQTLRKHLEYLSNEGSQSASDCLRSLNWDLLDLITWPIFMVEYLLIHSTGLKPGFDLSHFKLFSADYYQQPPPVKVEILRVLCDDLIEVEAIRSELNRRSLAAAEPEMVFERNINFEVCKKRRTSVDASSGFCLNDDVVDDSTDWNSDECCLCKMDGSLICCDGCPAAYHSKCVGVANDLLPEGDWFCPECAIDRHKSRMKPRKSLRGADLLGTDPHGRVYFYSCDYLLVSDSYDTESSFSYYHRDDLNMVVEVLKSSDFFYGDILLAICKHWDNVSLNGTCCNNDSLYLSMSLEMRMKEQIRVLSNPPVSLASTETYAVKNGTDVERKRVVDSDVGFHGSDTSKSVNLLDSVAAKGSLHVASEGSVGSAQTKIGSGTGCDSSGSTKFLNQSDIPGNIPLVGDCSLTSSTSDIRRVTIVESVDPEIPLITLPTKKRDTSHVQNVISYMNYYSFGQIASSVGEELMDKSSEKIKEPLMMSEEEVILHQTKAILKKTSKFYWSTIQDLYVDVEKEKCGWCFSCRAPCDDRDCLFLMNVGPIREASNSDMVDHQLKKNSKDHLTDVLCHTLSIEKRLHGLLLGPWLNPQHSKLLHKSALEASDLMSVKHLLLTLESNLSRLALSADWLKHVDSAVSVGSASHIVTSSARAASKHMIGRKRPRCSENESNPASNGTSGLGMFWWRGGRLSRHIFSWKALPHSLVSKAARQAGCVKIPGISYPENSEYAKRSKYVAWQAAVETSRSAEQLAFQVRELDLNIRWDDIENTHPLSALDKESLKSIRLFKKVIIRRKCTEGKVAKYLLDFGKRRVIPEIVKKHGSIVEESSSERKRYWLDESYVPLHLLKNFEEKRIARKSTDMKSRKIIEFGGVIKRPQEKRGFEYLFAKAERSENYQCGHCNKDVLVREAVSCQYCQGFFHKRHVKKSAGAIIADCTYTCHRCQSGKHVKIDAKRGKTNKKGGKSLQKSKNNKKDGRSLRLKSKRKVSGGGRPVRSKNNRKVAPSVPLRRSARKAKCIIVQTKKHGGRKKGKQIKSKKGTDKKRKRGTSCQKKRTQVYYSYWLNGLYLSRKPNDERVMLFREKNFLVPSEQSSIIPDQPKCQLCNEAEHASTLSYIACEICGEWFHGDAFGLHSENIDKLIGFKCHTCREKGPPVCPHLVAVRTDVSQLVEAQAQNNTAVDCFEGVSNAVPSMSEIACN
nr:DDT domain-containing protein PTM-like isoform X3 [Ziziphus jujuba var. spinosa]